MNVVHLLPIIKDYDPRAHGALCDSCPCKGQIVVPPTTPSHIDASASTLGQPDAIFVGRDPGYEEERQGKVLIGPTGKRLNKVLNRFGIDRTRLHLTNAALCWARHDEDRPKAHKCCRPRLEKEIAQYDKSVPVVSMGNEALWATTGTTARITLSRGFVWNVNGREVYPTIHPAFVLRDQIQSPLLHRDIRRVAKRIKQGHLTLAEPPSVEVPRTKVALKRLLRKFGPVVALDVETSREAPTTAELLCIGLSDVATTIVVPWEPRFSKIINDWMQSKTIICHNGPAFDHIVLAKHDMHVNKWEDTLISHHVFASHFPQRLDHLVSFYLDAQPWKIQFGKRGNDEKGQPKRTDDEDELHKYNALDVYFTMLVWREMQGDREPVAELCKSDNEVAAMCRSMQESGMLVDIDLKNRLSKDIKEKESRLYNEMKEIAGFEFAPTKTADLRKILFETLKAPVLLRTEKKQLPSTGKDVLWELSIAKDRPYAPFCQKLTELRRCLTIRKMYLDKLPVELDTRVHPSWRSFGTPTGRFACRKPNVQNLKNPDERFKHEPEQRVREIYVAPEGYTLVAFDAEQLEPRITAYLSDDPAFIDSVESGDYHTANARILFGNIPALATKQAAKTIGKDLRQVAKKSGLAIAYGAGADKVYETIRKEGITIRYQAVVAALDRLQKSYKVYYKFVEANLDRARKTGNLQVGFLSGRLRWLGHAPDPSKISNGPIQGGAGDLMNLKLPKIWHRLPEGARLIGQVHDSGVFEVRLDRVEEVKQIINDVWAEPVQIGRHCIVFPIEMKQGNSWGEI